MDGEPRIGRAVNVPPPPKGRRWTRFFTCILLVLVFIYVIGPLLSGAPLVRELTRFIDERSIEAGALFYTEVEEFSEADVRMRNTRWYAPGREED